MKLEVIRALIPNLSKEKSEMIAHGMKWFLPEEERIERQKYIDEAQRYWIDNEIIKSNYFDNPVIRETIKMIPMLQPISIEMIEDYISGIVFLSSALKDEKFIPVINKLTKPTLDKIAECMLSDVHRNHVINRIIPKEDSISIEMFSGTFDIKNKREALKGYIKDKPIYPSKDKIAKLIMDFSIHQKNLYNHLYKEQTGQTITGFACLLHPEIVTEVYYLLAEKFIRGNLNDFKAIFSNESNTVNCPITWLVINQRGLTSGRGNQTALFVFLEMMLKKVSNQDLVKCKDLFIDEKGKFIKKQLLRPDKTKILTIGFETQLKGILEKADHHKNL